MIKRKSSQSNIEKATPEVFADKGRLTLHYSCLLWIFIFISAPAFLLRAQDSLITRYVSTNGLYETRILIIKKGKDTLSIQKRINGKLNLSINYEKGLVVTFDQLGHGMDKLYYNFAGAERRFNLMNIQGPQTWSFTGYKGRKKHGLFYSYQEGKRVMEGNYWNGKRYGIWMECNTYPPYSCERYFAFGRGHSNTEILWTLSEFAMVIYYLFAFPFGFYLSFILARKPSRKIMFMLLGLFLFTYLFALALSLPEPEWAHVFTSVLMFFCLIIYLPARLVRGNNSPAFKLLAVILLIVQILILIFSFAIRTTNFSN